MGPLWGAVSPARPRACRTVQRDELPALEDACATFARVGHRFERLEATRQQLAELFKVRPSPPPPPPRCVPSPVCPLPGVCPSPMCPLPSRSSAWEHQDPSGWGEGPGGC